MKRLLPLTLDSAPLASKAALSEIQKNFGFLPNLMATFAHAPAVLNGYLAMDAAWDKSSLTPQERQIVLLTASVQNHCNYCKAAHSTVLKKMMKADAQMVANVTGDKPLADEKLNALVSFTRELVNERGFLSENTKNAFLGHGYTEAQMMEVVIGVALKTVSNYIDHLNPVEIDSAFASEA